jgi:IPT/TIG domain
VYVATWSNQVAVYGLIAPAPILTTVSPTSGPTTGGTSVTLTGQNFASGATVTFGGTAATSVVVVSTTQMTAKTPPRAKGSVNVVVTNSDGQSATLATGFTYRKH